MSSDNSSSEEADLASYQVDTDSLGTDDHQSSDEDWYSNEDSESSNEERDSVNVDWWSGSEDCESGVEDHESGVENHESGVEDHESGVEDHESVIEDHESGVEDHESGVEDHESGVEDHDSRSEESESGNEDREADNDEQWSGNGERESDDEENGSSNQGHESGNEDFESGNEVQWTDNEDRESDNDNHEADNEGGAAMSGESDMDAVSLGYDDDIFQDEDSNERNREEDEHRASPAPRLSGASSQAAASTALTRQAVSGSPILTLPTVDLTGANTSPEVQLGRNRERSPAADTSLPGPSKARDRNSEEPPAKIAKTENRTDVSCRSENDDDGETCSICLDRWSNSGEHRIAALKCGHLFGHSCVRKWLQSKPVKDRKCPSCKANANLRDLRYLYARRLVAVDTSEIETLQRQLSTTKEEKNRIELELRQAQLTAKSNVDELTRLRSVLQELKSGNPANNQRGPRKWNFPLEKTLVVTQEPTCRVLAYNCRKYELYASQKSQVPLFPGFGIRKINCVDLKPGAFVHLHPKAIRDLQYSASDDILLSVSQDKTAKIVCGQNSQIVNTVKTDYPLWSCCWSRPNEFIVGGDNATTFVYDSRMLTAPIERLQPPAGADKTPVVSLASTPEGFLSCHLNSCWFYRRIGVEYRAYMLPVDGAFLSLSYDDYSKQVLVSCRPTQGYQRARHVVSTLDVNRDTMQCLQVHTFMGSTVQSLMSRSRQLRLGDESWVAAPNESAKEVCLYSMSQLKLTCSLSMQDPVLDLCPVELSNGSSMLATLSSSMVRLYKAVSV